MAIVKLKKLTLCGFLSDKTRALTALQNLGGIHLIALQDADKSLSSDKPGYSEAAAEVSKFLADCPRKRQQMSPEQPFDLDNIVKRALAIKLRIRELSDLADALGNLY